MFVTFSKLVIFTGMNAVKVLIVENEVLVSEYLTKHLKSSGYLITDVVASGEMAIQSFLKITPDIILMDIELDGILNGIQTAKKLNLISSTTIIYLTKFSDKQTFQIAKQTDPASFLVKPFNQRDIKNAIELAMHNAANQNRKTRSLKQNIENHYFLFNNNIFIKNNKNHYNKIELADILWIESDGAYTIIQTLLEEHTIAANLKTVLSKIQNPFLVRVHRSYIVNVSRIKSIIGKEKLVLDIAGIRRKSYKNDIFETGTLPSKKEIPIGKGFRSTLFNLVKTL